MIDSQKYPQCQYLVQAPLTVMVALHLFCIPLMIIWILYCGIAFHSLINAFSNSCKELNGWSWWFSPIRLFSMSQPCPIGSRSGERLGQGNVLALLSCKRFMGRCAMCGRTVELFIQWLSYHNQVGLSCVMHSSPHHQTTATKVVNWHNTSLRKAFTRPSPDTNAIICKL